MKPISLGYKDLIKPNATSNLSYQPKRSPVPVMPTMVAPRSNIPNIVMAEGGKGFGGGEATRDPEPTQVDPNDPKGKQQAIHKAESFADYLERRKREGKA